MLFQEPLDHFFFLLKRIHFYVESKYENEILNVIYFLQRFLKIELSLSAFGHDSRNERAITFVFGEFARSVGTFQYKFATF